MPLSSVELGQLRQAGLSDDKIVQGLSSESPADAPDIRTLQQHGLNSTQILNGMADFQSQNPPSQSILAPQQPQQSGLQSALSTADNFGKALLYGTGNAAAGAASTEGNVLGAPSSVTSAEQGVANAAKSALGNYDPAGPHVSWNHPSTWGYIPRAIAESAPDLAGAAGVRAAAGLGVRAVAGMALGDVVAPEVTIPLQAAALGAYWLNRGLGQSAQSQAAKAGHPNNVTSSDVISALPGAAGAAALNTLGTGKLFAPSEVTGAGLQALKQTATNVGKTALTNAATSAGSSALTNVADGQNIDPTAALNAGVVGGAAAGALKGLGSVPDAFQSKAFAGGDVPSQHAIAQDLNSDVISGNPNNPKDNARMLASAGTIYNKQISDNISDLTAQAKELEKQGQSSTPLNSVIAQANNLVTNLKNGVLDSSQTQGLRGGPIGQVSPDLANNLLKLNELNSLKNKVGLAANASGSDLTIYDKLRTAHVLSHYMPWAGGGAALTAAAHNPVWLGLTAAIPALSFARKAGRAVTGSSDPVSTFVRRFGALQKANGSPLASPLPTQPDEPQVPPQVSPESPTPLVGQIMPPVRPAGLLPPPGMPMGSDGTIHGDNFTAGQPFTPQGEPQAPPAPPPRLNAPQRALPAPDVLYGPETTQPAQPFPWQRQTTGPAFTMQATPAAVQRPQPSVLSRLQAAQQESRPQEPVPAEPQAPIEPVTAVPRQAPPIAPKTLNEQADLIQKTIEQAQSVMADPAAGADMKAAARMAMIKAAMAGANMQQATRGGQKAVGRSEAFNPHVQRVPHESGEHVGSSSHEKTVEPKTIHIKTEHLTRSQSVEHIRRSAGAIAAGINKRAGTREQIARGSQRVPLSPKATSELPGHISKLLSVSNGVTTRAEGASALHDFLGHFSGTDHEALKSYFDNARADTGMSFLDSWKYKNKTEKDAGLAKAASSAKRKATRAAKRHK